MTSRNLKGEFSQIVRTVIAPLMKAQGFERRGQSFRRLHGEVFQYFSVEGNRYNDAEHFSFTGNFLEDSSFDELSKLVNSVLKDQLLPLFERLQNAAAVQAYQQVGNSSSGG